MPTAFPDAMSHTTWPSPGRVGSFSPPQQSAFLRHRSPVTWQPLAGWQIFTPVGPKGAHKRLQQSPQPPHTTPSTPVQNAGPEGCASHVPRVLPVAIVQLPVQQSWLREHTSLV